VQVPPLPEGQHLELPGRGTTFYRDVPGPPGAPTVLLLHGWTATADLNWFTCYEPLGEHFRVIALDHRGHGRGIRSRRAFRLADCADDAVALCDALGVERFLVVGYSMGGTVAQLVWRRHRQRVDGMVLSSTASHFASKRDERLSFVALGGLGAIARATPAKARNWLTEYFYLSRKRDQWEPWAVQEATLHDWRMVLEAGGAIGRFSSERWIAEVDVPTSVILTLRDHIVPIARQALLFESIPGAEAYRIDGDHDACVSEADQYVPTLIRALHSANGRQTAARAAVAELTDLADLTGSGQNVAQVEADVERGSRVGEGADGDEVDSGLADGPGGLEREPAARFEHDATT
jgi:3-oxoadipate enol-lactonase